MKQQRARSICDCIGYRRAAVRSANSDERSYAFSKSAYFRDCMSRVKATHAMSDNMNALFRRYLLKNERCKHFPALLHTSNRIHLRHDDCVTLTAQVRSHAVKVVHER